MTFWCRRCKRAFALAEVDDVAVVVGQDLHLDVPRRVDQPLQEEGVIAEGAAATRRAVASVAAMSSSRSTTCMPLPPPPAEGLISRGKPTPGAASISAASVKPGSAMPGTHGHAVGHHVVLGTDLVAHDLDGVNAGADERDAGCVQGLGELHVLGQESVAGVDGLGAALQASLDDGVDPQVAVRRRGRADADGSVGFAHVAGSGVGVRVDRHRADAHGLERADDAAGDLAAVGDEKHGCRKELRLVMSGHIRKRPKEVSGRGGRETTSRAMPRTRRVSAGSMMPSSQSRAVE